MTISPIEPQQQAALPAMTDDYTGLEEFGVDDMVTPRISIIHREGQFKDSLTNGTFSTLHLIILGLVKQRILWPERMAENDKPMCRSNDHNTGYVNLKLGNKPADKQFPWNKSNFDPNQQTLDADGRLTLPCEGCELKEWGSHPDGKKPFCAEMFTLPVMYDPTQTGNWVPALISFQKTQLKPLRAYLSAFQRMGTPPFQVYTQVDLEVLSFGQNPFSVPKFQMGQQTDPARWVEYAQNSRSMANFLRVPPRAESEQVAAAVPAPSNNQWGAPTQQSTPENPWGQAEAPVQQQWPPTQQPIQGVVNPQPVQQQPVAAQMPPQQAPVQQPVQQAPVQQPVQQQPVQQAPVQTPVQAPVQQQAAPPPFQQAAPAPAPVAQQPVAPPVAPEPAPQEAAPQAAAAPVADPSGIVGGWAAQVGATPQETAPQTPEPAPAQPEPVTEQPAQQQAPAYAQAPVAQGEPLPF